METEPFNEADYTDEQLVAILAMKGRYADGHDQLSPRELQNLRFTKWYVEHGGLDEFNVKSDDAA